MPFSALPWELLGQPGGCSGTLPSLRRSFGTAWSTVSRYFIPTQRLALAIDCPNPGGDGCPRQIIEHGFDDLVAVCGNSASECEPIAVPRADLIIYTLKTKALLADVNALLQIQGAGPEMTGDQTWELGMYATPGRTETPVVLCLATEAGDVHRALVPLLQRTGQVLMLLPSRQLCPPSLLRLTPERQCVKFAFLDELPLAPTNAEAALFLARYAPEASSPPEPANDNSFWWRQDYWHIHFQGKSYSCKQSKGMNYIAILIENAYRHDTPDAIPATTLYYQVHGTPTVVNEGQATGLSAKGLADGFRVGGADEGLDVITPEGIRRMRQQLRQLAQEQQEAEEEGAREEALRVRQEREALEDSLRKAITPSGRSKQTGGQSANLRKNIGGAIAYALAAMEKKKGEDLAQYLKARIKLGSNLSFLRDPEREWKIITS